MLLDPKSKWFRAYCRAVMEDDPEVVHGYIRDAFVEINQRSREPDLNDSEREALSVASRYLSLIARVELAKSA